MSEEDVDANQQQYCDAAEEMTKSIASTRELIQALREKYGLHALAVRFEHLQPIGADRKRHPILTLRMASPSSP
jgi:hypothetical protein